MVKSLRRQGKSTSIMLTSHPMQQKVASVHQACRKRGKEYSEGFRSQQYLQGEYICQHPPDIYTVKEENSVWISCAYAFHSSQK
jgi:hypothetical protein